MLKRDVQIVVSKTISVSEWGRPGFMKRSLRNGALSFVGCTRVRWKVLLLLGSALHLRSFLFQKYKEVMGCIRVRWKVLLMLGSVLHLGTLV